MASSKHVRPAFAGGAEREDIGRAVQHRQLVLRHVVHESSTASRDRDRPPALADAVFSGPAPTMAIWAPSSRATAVSTRSCPFSGTRLPTDATNGRGPSPSASRACLRSRGQKSSVSTPFLTTSTWSSGTPRPISSRFSAADTAITHAACSAASRIRRLGPGILAIRLMSLPRAVITSGRETDEPRAPRQRRRDRSSVRR